MSLVVKFYADPGHGWGAVKKQVLHDLGIADKITPYSYIKGDTVYLEEDCDLPTLITTLAQKGVTVSYTASHTNGRSPIRSYLRYTTM
mgnify:CR=1 FL=1